MLAAESPTSNKSQIDQVSLRSDKSITPITQRTKPDLCIEEIAIAFDPLLKEPTVPSMPPIYSSFPNMESEEKQSFSVSHPLNIATDRRVSIPDSPLHEVSEKPIGYELVKSPDETRTITIQRSNQREKSKIRRMSNNSMKPQTMREKSTSKSSTEVTDLRRPNKTVCFENTLIRVYVIISIWLVTGLTTILILLHCTIWLWFSPGSYETADEVKINTANNLFDNHQNIVLYLAN